MSREDNAINNGAALKGFECAMDPSLPKVIAAKQTAASYGARSSGVVVKRSNVTYVMPPCPPQGPKEHGEGAEKRMQATLDGMKAGSELTKTPVAPASFLVIDVSELRRAAQVIKAGMVDVDAATRRKGYKRSDCMIADIENVDPKSVPEDWPHKRDPLVNGRGGEIYGFFSR